jgi:hypothetical protein
MDFESFPFDSPDACKDMVRALEGVLSGWQEYRNAKDFAPNRKVHNRFFSPAEAWTFVEETAARFDLRGYRLLLTVRRGEGSAFPFTARSGSVQIFSPVGCARHVGSVSDAQVEAVVALLKEQMSELRLGDKFVESIDPFLDDEAMAILCARVLPILLRMTQVNVEKWQKKALACASPRLLQFVVNNDLYDMNRNPIHDGHSQSLFRARNPLAIRMLIDEGHDVNCSIAPSSLVVPLHTAPTLQCVRAMLAEGADPKRAVAAGVPLPRACVLSWICHCVPGFELPVERILKEGRTFDYVKLLVEELKVELPQELIPTLSLETKWCLRALGMRVEISDTSPPDLRWLRWRPSVHKYFGSMVIRRRAVAALIVFRRVAGFVPRDIRNKILIMAMN